LHDPVWVESGPSSFELGVGRVVRQNFGNVSEHSAKLGLKWRIAIPLTTWVGYPEELFLEVVARPQQFLTFSIRHDVM
jgi:hypothetical protein